METVNCKRVLEEIGNNRPQSVLLTERIQSNRPKDLRVDPDDLFRQAHGPVSSSGEVNWEPFAMDLSTKSYRFVVIYFGGPSRSCTWTYQGKFQLQRGRWVALPPVVISQVSGR